MKRDVIHILKIYLQDYYQNSFFDY